MLPYFLKKVPNSNSLQFDLDGKELIFFIPSMYFDRKFAETIEGRIKLFGLFYYIIRDKKTNKDSELYSFNFPSCFETLPSSNITIRDMDYEGLDRGDYNLLKYEKGDIVILSTKVIQNIENIEVFSKLLNSGNIPNILSYDQLQNLFTENISLNGKKYNLNMQLFGLIIGELATSKDGSELFRHTNMDDLYNYKIKNIKQAPKEVSAYSSYTSEVYDEAVINASMIKDKAKSPMEQLFMGYY